MKKKTTHFPVGTRVFHKSGRFGTTVSAFMAHYGYRVAFDTKANSFEPDAPMVVARDVTPTDPVMHARYEAAWPSFEQKHRVWANGTEWMEVPEAQAVCATVGHEPWVFATKNSDEPRDFGAPVKRVRYCTGCGMDRPSRRKA
jgi:hypothetical protein